MSIRSTLVCQYALPRASGGLTVLTHSGLLSEPWSQVTVTKRNGSETKKIVVKKKMENYTRIPRLGSQDSRVLEQRQAVQHLHPLSRAQCSLQTMLRLPVCIQLRACVHVCLYVFVSYQQHPKRHGLPPTTSGVKSCLFGSGTCWLSRDSVRRALGRVPSRARGRHSLTSVGL